MANDHDHEEQNLQEKIDALNARVSGKRDTTFTLRHVFDAISVILGMITPFVIMIEVKTPSAILACGVILVAVSYVCKARAFTAMFILFSALLLIQHFLGSIAYFICFMLLIWLMASLR